MNDKKIVEYKILHQELCSWNQDATEDEDNNFHKEFSEEVNVHIGKGWHPVGGHSIIKIDWRNFHFFQTMVKYEGS